MPSASMVPRRVPMNSGSAARQGAAENGSIRTANRSASGCQNSGVVTADTADAKRLDAPLSPKDLAIAPTGKSTDIGTAVRTAIKLIESRKYPIEKMVTHRFTLEQADYAVRAAGGEEQIEGFIKGVIVPA